MELVVRRGSASTSAAIAAADGADLPLGLAPGKLAASRDAACLYSTSDPAALARHRGGMPADLAANQSSTQLVEIRFEPRPHLRWVSRIAVRARHRRRPALAGTRRLAKV
jgi:hypothetical protein